MLHFGIALLVLLLAVPAEAVTFRSASHSDAASATSCTVTTPSGTSNNDLLLALIVIPDSQTVSSAPSGWTVQVNHLISGVRRVYLYSTIAASEGSDYTWTITGAGRLACSVTSWHSGFDTSSPIDEVSSTGYTTNDTILRAAGVTTTTATGLIFVGMSVLSSTVTSTPPTSPDTFTEHVDVWNADSRTHRTFASLDWSSSGATGNIDAELSTSLFGKHAMLVELVPASSSSPAMFQRRLVQ